MGVMPSQQGGHGGGKGEAAGHTASAVRAQNVVGIGTQLPMPYNVTQAPQPMESCLLQFGWIFLPQWTQSRNSFVDTILSPESRFCHRVIAFESCTSVTLPVPRCPSNVEVPPWAA